ncbi:MAG: hypothetical protein GX028_04175, partial [Clostridiaceae bacterium]|nr:hypothetical protein [Clostridiaceae bacterium]
LRRVNGETAGAVSLIKSFLKSPVILSIIFGIIAGLIGLPALLEGNAGGGAVLETLDLIGSLTMPLICLVIGFELRIDKTDIARPFFTALSRIILLIGLAFVINKLLIAGLLGLDRTYEVALYTLFMLPPPFVIPIYMSGRKMQDKQLILNTISMHIILTLIAFMGLILIFK